MVHFSDVWTTGAAATGPNVWHRTTGRGFNQRVCSKIEAVTVGGLWQTKLPVQYERQKAFYDQKIHWDPYTQGDLVWLHSSSVFVGSCIMSGRCLFKHFSVYPMVIIILIVSMGRSKYRLFTLIASSCAHQGLSSWTIPSLIRLRQRSMNWIHLLLGQIKLEVIQQMSKGPQFCLGILLGINRLQASMVTIFPLA